MATRKSIGTKGKNRLKRGISKILGITEVNSQQNSAFGGAARSLCATKERRKKKARGGERQEETTGTSIANIDKTILEYEKRKGA